MAYNSINTTNQLGRCVCGGTHPPTPPTPSPTTAIINCDLQVALSPENTAVYVCKGKKQCFNFTALKCCGRGNITINLLKMDSPVSSITVENFGTFTMNASGICFEPDANLGKNMNTTETSLNFKASACGVEDFPFVVHFVYDPCRCCCKCRKC